MYKSLVIIPAYNEEEAIQNVIKSIRECNDNVDILVVNDGSKDDTAKKVNELNCNLLDLPFNLGIGGAMQAGYLYAYQNDYDAAIQVDGDGQHNPIYINEMLEKLKDYDMVIGSRYLEKTKYKSSFSRRVGDIPTIY